jgi:hypothetical protein
LYGGSAAEAGAAHRTSATAIRSGIRTCLVMSFLL